MEATLGGNIARDAVEGDYARARLSFACDELFALDNLVPAAVAFINRGVGWRLDGLVIDDMRINGDDLPVRVEDIDGELARDEAGDGRYHREHFMFS